VGRYFAYKDRRRWPPGPGRQAIPAKIALGAGLGDVVRGNPVGRGLRLAPPLVVMTEPEHRTAMI
jgi:hypothetical protein